MDARQAAAERILNRGVRFRLPASFFSRLFRKNLIIVKPLYPGAILEFATVVLENNLEEAVLLSDYAALAKSIKPVAKCVAISILNNKLKIEKETDELTEKILWKYKPELIIQMFSTIEKLNRVGDFMNITRFYVRQTLMMMNPNLGQEKNGR